MIASGNQNPLIRKLESLHPLTAEDKAYLEGACSRTLKFDADEDIVLEGDRPSDCNVLLEGVACRYKILAVGTRQIFSFHFPGDIFDAQSFLLNTMDHSVAALTRCKVALIPHAKMTEITETHPRIARAIWKDTLVDAATFREWMMNVARRPAYARLAHLICELFTRLRMIGLTQGDHAELRITQSQLGDAIGLSLVHVNRTMQELRGDGLLSWSGSKLTIHNWEGLKKAGDFDPTYLHLRTDVTEDAAGASGHA